MGVQLKNSEDIRIKKAKKNMLARDMKAKLASTMHQ